MESTTTAIELNDFRRQWTQVGASVLEAVEGVGRSGWYILGSEVSTFEEELAEAWPVGHAVGVASGLDALEIGLRCLGIEPGERVLTTPLSAFATTLAILRIGAKPVFVDVDASGLIDLTLCRDHLRRGTAPRTFLPVHLYGHALDAEELASLKADFDLRILEDCAQSIGARSRGDATGSVGEVAATSFYPTKNLGALGDGGAVLTGDGSAAQRARVLRHYGQTETYVHEAVGLNSRLDELQAAILRRSLLPALAGWTGRRRHIAARYRAEIANDEIGLPAIPAGSDSSWHLFSVLVAPAMRSAFRAHLSSRGVNSGLHYPRLITDQRALAAAGGGEVLGDLRVAKRFCESQVSLPVHPFLGDEEVARVIAACNEWSGS